MSTKVISTKQVAGLDEGTLGHSFTAVGEDVTGTKQLGWFRF